MNGTPAAINAMISGLEAKSFMNRLHRTWLSVYANCQSRHNAQLLIQTYYYHPGQYAFFIITDLIADTDTSFIKFICDNALRLIMVIKLR
jgi:hypothetical protein